MISSLVSGSMLMSRCSSASWATAGSSGASLFSTCWKRSAHLSSCSLSVVNNAQQMELSDLLLPWKVNFYLFPLMVAQDEVRGDPLSDLISLAWESVSNADEIVFLFFLFLSLSFSLTLSGPMTLGRNYASAVGMYDLSCRLMSNCAGETTPSIVFP